MEETGYEIVCCDPTTLAVRGLMMMMMMIMVVRGHPSIAKAVGKFSHLCFNFQLPEDVLQKNIASAYYLF